MSIRLKTKKVSYVILFMIVFIFSLNYSPNTSYACSCLVSGTVEEELERSSAVFSGKVIEIIDKNKDELIQSSADPIAVIFEVEETWKGVSQTQVIVYTERDSASCGFGFSLNQEYLVYANEDEGTYRANICSRTALLSSAQKDVNELGKGEKPTEQVSIDLVTAEEKGQVSLKNPSNNKPIYIAVLIVGLLLLVVYLTRRFQKS